jgi:hypothetical protein
MAGAIDTSTEAVKQLAEHITRGPHEAWEIVCANTLRALVKERDVAVADEIAHSHAVNRAEADRDRLAAEVAKMREALAGVLDVAKNYGGWQAQDDPRCVAARAALAGGTDGK